MSGPRFVELVRVSTDGQADRDTPEIQRRALDRLRIQRPGTLVERIDGGLGLSGALPFEQRPDLKRVLALAGKYDELRVYAIDRLTRNADPRERWAIYGMVADSGASIVDANGAVTDPADPAGEMAFFLHGFGAAGEKKRILARTMDGRKRAAGNGRLPGGSTPYGRTFNRDTGEWSLDRERSSIYRRMFSKYLKGASVRDLVEWLNGQPVPPPRAGCGTWTGQWARSTVLKMLRNPTALGTWTTWGATIQVPPIIDPDTFARVQARLSGAGTRAGRPSKDKGEVLLRKLLSCGLCGACMYVDRNREGDGWIYRCGSRCGAIGHHAKPVDAAVRARVLAFVRRPEVETAENGTEPDHAEVIADAQAELVRLDQEEERLARLGRRGLFSEKVLLSQTAEVAALRAGAKQRLAMARASAQAYQGGAALREQLGERVRDLRARVGKATPAQWRHIVGLLFPRGPSTGLRLHPDGRIEGAGRLELAAGEAKEVAAAQPHKLNTTCSDSVLFPVRVLTAKPG